jgi:hypothetical protein
MNLIRAKPWLIANNISKKTNIKVIAASDGLEIPIKDI